MPRKFRLSVPRKNEFRKAHAQRCTVSVQHISPKPENVCMASTSRESDEELIVSIPIDVVHDSGVSTIAELQRQINILSILHDGKLMAS